MIMAFLMPLQAQIAPSYTQPSWWFGVSSGANFNFHQGSTQQLNADFTAPAALGDAYGVGLFLAPSIEYYKPNSLWGLKLQVGYDNRKAQFDETLAPCNNSMDLSTNLSYLTIEPSLRFAPGRSNFYLYAGPRFAFLLDESFEYQLKAGSDNADHESGPVIEGDFNNMNNTVLSMQVGAGYDIPLNSRDNRTQLVISPFASFYPYFGQDPRSVESWNISSLRVGATLKFGVGKEIPPERTTSTPSAPPARDRVDFSIDSPENIPAERTVRETFPVLNYVFFDSGSTEIPERYVLLRENQVEDFKEDQLDLFPPENLSGRSDRQLEVYYNILNILGDRMSKDQSSNITLIGSSDTDTAEGNQMAESIKSYLVDIFSIDASRITTRGVDKPEIPAAQSRSSEELALLQEEGRRVSLESNSPNLLMEFQTGPGSPLKPVEFVNVQDAPVESYVTFNNRGADREFTSWTMQIEDEDGRRQNFGPYRQDRVAIPGKSIMGSRERGDYNVKMIGRTRDGRTIERESKTHMILWKPSEAEEVMRFSVTYEFDKSDAIERYDRYLEEVVMPKIPQGGKVIIHGYTDEIGEAQHNRTLSLARANDVKNTLQRGLDNAGRTDVEFIVHGFGEDPNLSPFVNYYPEGRFHNRAVIIDIVPQ